MVTSILNIVFSDELIIAYSWTKISLYRLFLSFLRKLSGWMLFRFLTSAGNRTHNQHSGILSPLYSLSSVE